MAHISLLEAGHHHHHRHHQNYYKDFDCGGSHMRLRFLMRTINLRRIFQECSFQIGTRRPKREEETQLVENQNIVEF